MKHAHKARMQIAGLIGLIDDDVPLLVAVRDFIAELLEADGVAVPSSLTCPPEDPECKPQDPGDPGPPPGGE